MTEAAADMRSIYGVSLWQVPLRELPHLVSALLDDPGSRLHAKLAKWRHPLSFEGMYALDVWDAVRAGPAQKRRDYKPHPRPWPKVGAKTLGGRTNRRRSRATVLGILRPERRSDDGG